MTKKISPALFGIVILCFFLPWFSVSCQGQKIITVTGIQLVTGTTIEEPKMPLELGVNQKNEKRKIEGEPIAILILLAAIAGLGLNFLLKGKRRAVGSVAVGGAGISLLLILKLKLDKNIMKETGGMLQLNSEIGFFLTALLFIFAIGVNIYSLIQEREMSLIMGKDKPDQPDQ
ncbi:hypothetical protein F1847_02940 [Thermodesulfobacterium sp. TA1]|uniref:hypothetical protein n=1 Tax=Thermodesulfobacterium sp. TA1 TaxID=2234087 RepID=UPI001231E64D|nr:hypothetical protein [Thermodesulfobacterium sp. TA1]QER41756.1 hypothetical protein F1847_02940 [Thermodesulfobacterium sp. TA1]